MATPGLTILVVSTYIHSIYAQISSNNGDFPVINLMRRDIMQQVDSHVVPPTQTTFQHPDGGVTTDLRSWGSRLPWHHHRHLRIVHGALNIVGWGMFLPIGVIIARYYRKLPFKNNDWYSLHIMFQTSGFILGTVGWGLGMSLRTAAKHHSMTTHGILGTIVFTFAAVQLLAICLQPKEEHDWRKYWAIYHHALGYALIALIVANIFQGIQNQSQENKWKWFYVVILGIFCLSAMTLEILTRIKFDHSTQINDSQTGANVSS